MCSVHVAIQRGKLAVILAGVHGSLAGAVHDGIERQNSNNESKVVEVFPKKKYLEEH